MQHYIIREVKIIDALSDYHNKVVDIEIKDGEVKKIGQDLPPGKKTVEIAGKGKFLSKAWIDTLGDVYTPGNEYRELLETGVEAAARGGFGTVIMTPNHHPAMYLASHVKHIRRETAYEKVSIEILGAVSKDTEGKELAEMYDMYKAGAVAFSDGWNPVQNMLLLSQALEYVKSFDGLIVQIPVHKTLNAGGLMNESDHSVAFGISGQPAVAEEIMIYNMLSLAQYQSSRIHIAGVSTQKGLKLIRDFKKAGVAVTCSVTPFHLLYNDAVLSKYESAYKVTPAIRSEKDRLALIKGIKDGTVDAVSSFNKPLSWDEKNKEFEYAVSGMAALRYVWPMLIQAAPDVSVERWVQLLVDHPSRIFKLQTQPGISEGSKGKYTLFDTTTDSGIESPGQAYNLPPARESFKGYTQLIF